MSFTIKVKEEIIAESTKDKAELSALIKMSGSVGLTNQGLTLSISTENAKIARHIYQLMESRYHIAPELRHHNKTNLKKNRVYTVFVADQANDILSDLQLADSFFGFETGIETSIIMLDAKVLQHKNGFVTYLQKAEDIMDFLLVIGAMTSKEIFEEVKIMRETRNDLNRANNAETANIARTISASMKTINNIIKIMDTVGLEILPAELRQIAQLRIANPDYSIQQIADSIEPPLTKSGVNHRLRKINKIADDL